MTTCIDLAERFGHLYRIGWEADGVSKSQWPREDWPWLRQIPCRHGEVYPFGGEILAAFTDRPRIGARLRALPCVRTARGDVETVITFHVDDAEAVLSILRPYRRRRLSLSDAQRAALAAGRRPFRKKDDAHVENRGFPDPESTQELEPSPAPRSEAARTSEALEGLVSGFQAEGKKDLPTGDSGPQGPPTFALTAGVSTASHRGDAGTFPGRPVSARPYRPAGGDDGP